MNHTIEGLNSLVFGDLDRFEEGSGALENAPLLEFVCCCAQGWPGVMSFGGANHRSEMSFSSHPIEHM